MKSFGLQSRKKDVHLEKDCNMEVLLKEVAIEIREQRERNKISGMVALQTT